MTIKNIAIRQSMRDIEKIDDYYLKVKKLCELSGIVAFYGHTRDNTHDSLAKTEKMARDTIELIVKKYKL